MERDKPGTFIPNKFKAHFHSENEANKFLFSNTANEFAVYPIEARLPQLKLPIYPHRKTVTSFLFLTSGSATKTCGLDSYEMEGNSVFVVPQGYLNGTQALAPDSTGFYCHFDFSIFPLLPVKKLKKAFPFLFTDDHPLIRLNESSSEALQFIMYRLISEAVENRENLNFSLISSYLVVAFQEIKIFFPKEDQEKFTRNTKITNDFKELLYNEVKNTKSVADFAEKLSVSPNHLNKCVKSTTGKTTKELINEALILEAKNLLHETDLSVGEIATELGLDDPAYFSRLFKQFSGNSPQQFRKRIEKSK